MPHPAKAPETFDQDIRIVKDSTNCLILSSGLIDILLSSREAYDWPRGTGAKISQQRIISIKDECAETIPHLDKANVLPLLLTISSWAGNRATGSIKAFTLEEKQFAVDQILKLNDEEKARDAILSLTELPGIDLVISTKIFRFFSEYGAALDRHSSYFFNSLPIEDNGVSRFSTSFKRQWSKGDHIDSRLAIYTPGARAHNVTEYFKNYLSIIQKMLIYLNTNDYQYFCPINNTKKDWVAADIEMAAYYWWALNGPK